MSIELTYPGIIGPDVGLYNSSSTIQIEENSIFVFDFNSDQPTATWAKEEGMADALFSIDSSTGVLSFKTSPDYENPVDYPGKGYSDNNYVVTITAENMYGLTSYHSVSVEVQNVEEEGDIPEPSPSPAPSPSPSPSPGIIGPDGGLHNSSSTIQIDENSTFVFDFDSDQFIYHWAESGGMDGALFSIDSSTGVLSFKTSPDYESPVDYPDQGYSDNNYILTISAENNYGSTSYHTISVEVQNVEEESDTPAQSPTPIPVTAPSTEPTPIPVTAPSTEPTPAPVTAPSTEPIPAPVTAPSTEPTPAPVTAPSTEPTPAPVPNENYENERIESIDDINLQDEVSTFELSAAISIGDQDIQTLIVGTKNKDKITGSSEGEVLAGGEGKDILKGGDGPDGFFFQNPKTFNKEEADIIKDFDTEEGDSVLLDKDEFDLARKIKLKVVTGRKAARGASKSKKDFIYDDKKGLLYFNENGKDKGWGDGGLLMKLQGAPELDTNDFTIT